MRFIRLLALLLGITLVQAGSAWAEEKKGPEHIRVGVFISNLFDVDFARQDVGAQF